MNITKLTDNQRYEACVAFVELFAELSHSERIEFIESYIEEQELIDMYISINEEE